MISRFIIIVIGAFFSWNSPDPSYNYREEFGNDYTWAINWLQQNNSSIEKYASLFNIPSKELKAIVFPELVRYNTVYDAIEINTLKYLYVSEGKAYADFSVGYFQMKPSFAQMIEEDANAMLDSSILRISGLTKFKNNADYDLSRKARITRITNLEDQLIYLCAFYKICQVKFAKQRFTTNLDKLKFFATCYNAGYRRNYAKLVSLQAHNYFHTGKLWSNKHYNYADICAYYFLHES